MQPKLCILVTIPLTSKAVPAMPALSPLLLHRVGPAATVLAAC